MDYSGQEATALYKYQWDLIHNPQRVWFAWLKDEEEGAILDFYPIVKLNSDQFPVKTGKTTFLTPAGLPSILPI